MKTRIDKTLANLTKREKEKTQISKIRDERRYIMTNMMKFRKLLGYILKTYITLNKYTNKFLDDFDMPKLIPNEISNLNRLHD